MAYESGPDILARVTALERRIAHLEAYSDAPVTTINDLLDPILGHRHRGLESDGAALARFEPAYNDLMAPIATGKVPAANYPAWTSYTTNLSSYTFAVNDYIDLQTAEALHGWREGTPIEVHVHFVTNGTDGTDRGVKFTVYYAIGDMAEAMSAEQSLTAEKTIPASTADKTHLYLSMGNISPPNYRIGCLVKLRIKRVAAVGTAPSANPFVEMVGLHYEVDAIGSRQQGVKD